MSIKPIAPHPILMALWKFLPLSKHPIVQIGFKVQPTLFAVMHGC